MLTNESGERVGEQSSTLRPPAQAASGVLLPDGSWRRAERLSLGAWGSSCKACVVPSAAEPHHVAGLDGRPRQGPAPSASCQGARCCHWKKLLHNLKSWSFDHCSKRMKRRGSKWWFENASVSLHPSVPIILSLVRDNPLDVFIFFCNQVILPSPSRPSQGEGRDGWEGSHLQPAPFLTHYPNLRPCLWADLCPLFFPVGLFFQRLVTKELSSAECCALPFCTCNPNAHFLSFRYLKLAFQGPAVLQS